MSVTVSVGTPLALSSLPASVDLGPTAPEALVVAVATGGGNFTHNGSTVTVSVGGQPLANAAFDRISSNVAAVYELLGNAMSGSQAVAYSGPTDDGTLVVYSLRGAGNGVLRLDEAQDAAASGAPSVPLDSGARPGVGIVAASFAGTSTPLAGTTEDHDATNSSLGHETAPGTGARSVGWAGNIIHAVAGALYAEAVPVLDGSRMGVGMGLRHGALSFEGVAQLPYRRVRGLRLGLRHGTLSQEAARQVALVGGGIETAGMTDVPPVPGEGPDVPVLVHRRARRPEFVQLAEAAAEAGIGGGSGDLASLHVDLSVSGAHDVDRDDGATHDLTLVGSATLTPTHSDPPAGEAIDLRVLVRQDGTGGWALAWGGTIAWATADGNPPTMPQEPNAALTVGFLSVDDATTWLGFAVQDGGTSDVESLDDLDDVTLTTPTEGDTLRYRSGEWVNEPLAVEAGLIPVDTGTPTYDDSGPEVGITLVSVWGYDGVPYYDDANASAGEEASLWWDPALGVYTLIPFEFPEA